MIEVSSLRDNSSRIDDADWALMRASASLRRSPADTGLKRLTKLANHSVLWFAIAAVMARRKGPLRRAGLRGVAGITGASAVTNLVVKQLFARRRPAAALVPARRRMSHPPTSSSFPSGHAASAAAFTTAVAMEHPPAALALAPVAAAVSYSRVHTGVHWPSDVAAGTAIGVVMAAVTTRWWPRRPEEPAMINQPYPAPAVEDGNGIVVLVNPAAGYGTVWAERLVSQVWPKAQVIRRRDGMDLAVQLEAELERHEPSSVRALGVAGGDGTVAAVASVATHRGLPLAVLSCGTLNHFAKDVGLYDPHRVLSAVRRGTSVAVDLGSVRVDERRTRWFINTASLGGYPDMVRLREKWAPRWGKWPAAAAALIRTMSEATPLRISLNGQRRKVWMVFVGNGSYRPRGLAPTWRPRLDNGLLDVRYIRADATFSRTRFVLAALTGALHRSRTYVQDDLDELDIIVHGTPVEVATDGEVMGPGARFRFVAHDKALGVYRTPEDTDA